MKARTTLCSVIVILAAVLQPAALCHATPDKANGAHAFIGIGDPEQEDRIASENGDTEANSPLAAAVARSEPLKAKTIHIAIQPMWAPAKNQISLLPGKYASIVYLSDATFDATTIDPATACFGSADEPSQRICGAYWNLKIPFDFDLDGKKDVMLIFPTTPSGIEPGDEVACATALTPNGVLVEGCDRIIIID
jgi:hypothetical protein